MGRQPGAGGPPEGDWPVVRPGVDPVTRSAGLPAPSGLFPAGSVSTGPIRPTYREPHPVRGGALAAGAALTAAWLLFLGLLGRQLTSYVWYTVLAGGVAWLMAWLLTRRGDRGAAAGVAISTALGWSVAATAVALRWAETGDWPLW